jgi:hypothetical protein
MESALRSDQMNNEGIQPGIWYYGLALLIAITGFAAFVGSIYSGISHVESSLPQMLAPGEEDFNLSEPGEYTVFYEDKSYFRGKLYSTNELISGLAVNVRERATGIDLATYPAKSYITYSLGGRSGRSAMAFRVDRAGVYQVIASYEESNGPEVVLAIGRGMIEGLFSSVLTSLAVLFGSIAIAVAVAFITYTRRKKALDRKKEEDRQIRGLSR